MNVRREQLERHMMRGERQFPVQRVRCAFSLIELIVVVGIIGVLAGLAIHSIPALRTGNQINAANRQVLDAVAEARARAISTRSTVYLVFVPPYFYTTTTGLISTLSVQKQNEFGAQWNNLIGGQYTSYAIYAERQVGDQPGSSLGRYLTEWRSLPKGTFFATNDLFNVLTNKPMPFPDETFPQTVNAPVIGFTAQGQLIASGDVQLHVAQGSLLFPRNPDGTYMAQDGEPREIPPFNSASNFIRINNLTGRGRIERPQIQ